MSGSLSAAPVAALVEAVSNVSLIIPSQEFVCLIGPSGCGKTTLLQLVAGLLPMTQGRIDVDGVPIAGPAPERGLVFQRDSVFPWMRVIDNAAYGLKCRGVGRAEREKIASDYLQQVGLSACRTVLAARTLGRHAEARRGGDGLCQLAEGAAPG